MKLISFKTSRYCLRTSIVPLLLVMLSMALFSFSVYKISEDFLQQLGISKTDADRKITYSILGGYLDQYGVRNAKNIAMGKRATVAADLLAYTKQYVKSDAFVKEYNVQRESAKPQPAKLQTPGEMQTSMIEQYKKSVEDMETAVKNATDASTKKIFEEVLVSAKQQLKAAQDPKSEMMAAYSSNYEEMLATNKASFEKQIQDWEMAYPANHLEYVKKRLQQFMDETGDIDFNAPLTERNGKKYFVNKAYESKGNRWKLAFRAGKEVVETARSFVAQWINEIE